MAEVDEDDEMAGVRRSASEPAPSSSSDDDRLSFKIAEADAVLKLKKRRQGVVVSLRCDAKQPKQKKLQELDWSFAVRPCDPYKNWRTRAFSKIAVNPSNKSLVWSVAKMQFKWFQWKIGVKFDLESRQLHWRYRVMSKWNTEGAKACRKERLPLNSHVLLQPHYSCDFQLPVVTGSDDSAAILEKPELHFWLSKVDMVFDIDGTGLQPFWRRQASQGKQEVRMVTDGALPCTVEQTSYQSSAPSELWMTQSPEPVPDKRLAYHNRQIPETKSQKPIPWCLDNPLRFPWLRRGHTEI